MLEIDEIMDEVSLLYSRQRRAKGLGDAVHYAKSFVGNSPVKSTSSSRPDCEVRLIKYSFRLPFPVKTRPADGICSKIDGIARTRYSWPFLFANELA